MQPRQISIPALTLSLMLLTTTAMAGSESGLYLGASLGQAAVKVDGTTATGSDFDFNEDDAGYKVFAGYNFGIVPFLDLAVEGSYVDFGNPSGSLADGTDLDFNVSGWDVFGLVGGTFGPFSLFGKAGLIYWDSDSDIGNSSDSDSGSDPAYGLGAKIQLGSIAVRAEYEYFDLSGFKDVYMTSVGLVFTF
jgi:opacity protein-like surface antigen